MGRILGTPWLMPTSAPPNWAHATSISSEGIAETRYAENRHDGHRPQGRFDVSRKGHVKKTNFRLVHRSDARGRRSYAEPLFARGMAWQRFGASCAHRPKSDGRSEEHTSELQSLRHLVC